MLVHDLPLTAVLLITLTWGLLWGSFFNVAIYRWPRGMSVLRPPSHCPHCQTPIRPWNNVPVFGWLWLRGKAACCGAPIRARYPVIEALTGVLGAAVGRWVVAQSNPETTVANAAFQFLVYFAFVGGLLIATFVDLEWMEIPDEVSLPGTALGLVTAPLRFAPGVGAAAVGAGIGFLLTQYVFVWGYEWLTGKRGMGEGDSKLLMMIGAFTGWKGAIFALVAGSFQGILYAVFALFAGHSLMPTRPDELAPDAAVSSADEPEMTATSVRGLKLPFGPFLALGALEFLFFGEPLVQWYLNLFRA